jgi:hypothetical protein
MTTNQDLPPAAAVVVHQVEDFDTWKAAFDEHESARRAVGVLGHHINRAEDDPNRVSLYLAVGDLAKAQEFAASEDLKTAMERGGVVGPPEVLWMKPVRESIVWDRELPAFMVSHRVADFDRWLEGYDDAAGMQRSGGIIGQAANRSLDDPSLAVVYHQAESFDTLRAFLDNPELKAAMESAGVTSEPEVSFHTGGWAKLYD